MESKQTASGTQTNQFASVGGDVYVNYDSKKSPDHGTKRLSFRITIALLAISALFAVAALAHQWTSESPQTTEIFIDASNREGSKIGPFDSLTRVELSASGVIQYGPDVDDRCSGRADVDPDGNRELSGISCGHKTALEAKVPDAPIGSLVGRLSGPGQGYFLIGSHWSGHIPPDTTLTLAVNDSDTDYFYIGNSGGFTVTVTLGDSDSLTDVNPAGPTTEVENNATAGTEPAARPTSWGIVVGADKTLEDANIEVNRAVLIPGLAGRMLILHNPKQSSTAGIFPYWTVVGGFVDEASARAFDKTELVAAWGGNGQSTLINITERCPSYQPGNGSVVECG